MNYSDMVEFHLESQADVTLATTPMPYEELQRFGTAITNEEGQVTGFQEKIKKPESNLVSMGVYIFKKDILQKCLEEDAQLRSSRHDFGRNVLPRIVNNHKVFAHRFDAYWRDVGTVAAYWQANMDLLDLNSSLLFDANWPVRTREEMRPPALISQTSDVASSIIPSGCIIEGQVEHSILSPGVKIGVGSVVKDSIILSDSVIGPGTVVDYSILDREVIVGAGCHIGYGNNFQINRREPNVANAGITIVGKRTKIPLGVKVGRNCIIYYGVTEDDFIDSEIESGETVRPRRRGLARKA
jgi:glucose-1-phosphate adenylyltransferase